MTPPCSNLTPKSKLYGRIFGSLVPIWCIFWHFIPCFPRTQSSIYFKSTNAWIFGSLVPILVHFSRPQVSFLLVWISFFYSFETSVFRKYSFCYTVFVNFLEITRLNLFVQKRNSRSEFTGFLIVFCKLHGLLFFCWEKFTGHTLTQNRFFFPGKKNKLFFFFPRKSL